MSSDQNGWNEWSRHVLKELETLSAGVRGLNAEIQDVKRELAEMKVKEDKVNEIKEWKEKIDEVASPSQLKTLSDEVQELKLFKTKAVTVFAVVQFAMGIAMWAIKTF